MEQKRAPNVFFPKHEFKKRVYSSAASSHSRSASTSSNSSSGSSSSSQSVYSISVTRTDSSDSEDTNSLKVNQRFRKRNGYSMVKGGRRRDSGQSRQRISVNVGSADEDVLTQIPEQNEDLT